MERPGSALQSGPRWVVSGGGDDMSTVYEQKQNTVPKNTASPSGSETFEKTVAAACQV